MMDSLQRIEKYIADYEDAVTWGGPTIYPARPDLIDLKALAEEVKLYRRSVEHKRAYQANRDSGIYD